jgi:arginyl-tRNA synthetase
LLTFSGYQVIRDNHLGDWGTQFGKQIVALKKWGSEQELAQSTQPVKYLVDLYVKFHTEAEQDPALEDEARAWFVKLEQGDAEARRIWKLCVEY